MALKDFIAPITGFVGNLASSLIGNTGAANAQKRANEFNLKMYEKQRADAITDRDLSRQWSLQDWNMQNEYNSPESQMMRYKDAGLNPNLIYGQGVSASSGLSQSQPRESQTRASQMGTSQAARYNMDFGMQQFAQNALMMSQAKKLDAETENIKATTGKTETETERLRTLLPLERDGMTVNIERTKRDIDQISSQILLNTKELDVKDQSILESNSRIRKQFNDTLIAFLEYQNHIEQLDINRTDAQTRRGQLNVNRGELSVHQADYSRRERETQLSYKRLNFEKQKQTFDDMLRANGASNDNFGSLWKTIGTGLRFTGPNSKNIDEPFNFKRPIY